MITKLIFTSILAFFFSSGFFMNGNIETSQQEDNSRSTEQVVRAIMHEGEILPIVNLPVVEITGKLNTERMVTAEIIDGAVVPVIHLDEVVVTPDSGLKTI